MNIYTIIKPGILFITNKKCIFTRLHKSKKRFITGKAVTFKTFPQETPLLFIKYIKINYRRVPLFLIKGKIYKPMFENILLSSVVTQVGG